MAHARHDAQAGAGNRGGGPRPADERDQRVVRAVHDQRRRAYAVQQRHAARPALDGDELPGEAVRPEAAAHRAVDLDLQLRVGRRIAGAADQPEKVVHPADRLVAVARRRPQERAQHFRARQDRGRGGHDRGQAPHPVRVLRGDDLRDHAAHRHADHMGGADPEAVHQPDRVTRHVVERIGRPHRQTEEGARQHSAGLELARGGHPARQADVAVVVAYDPETARGEALAQRIRPRDELHAEAHDEQDRRRAGRPEDLILDGDSIRFDGGHRCLPRAAESP